MRVCREKGMGPIFGVFIILLLFVVGFLFTTDTTYNVKNVLDVVRVQEQVSEATNIYNTLYVYSSLVTLGRSVRDALDSLAQRGLIYVPVESDRKDIRLMDVFSYGRVLLFNGSAIGVWQKVEKDGDKLKWTFAPPILQSQVLYPISNSTMYNRRHVILNIDKRGKLLIIYASTPAKAIYNVRGKGCDVRKYNSLEIESNTYYGAYLLNMKGEKCEVIVSSSLPIYSFYYFVYSFIPPEDFQPYHLDLLRHSPYYGGNSEIRKILRELEILGIQKKDHIYLLKRRIEDIEEARIDQLNRLQDVEFAKHFYAYRLIKRVGRNKVQQLISTFSSLNVDEKLILSQIIGNLKESDAFISLDDIKEGRVNDKIEEYIEDLKRRGLIAKEEIINMKKITTALEDIYNTGILTQLDKEGVIGMFMDSSDVKYIEDILKNKGGIEDQIREIEEDLHDLFSFDVEVERNIDECIIYNSLSQIEEDVVGSTLSNIRGMGDVRQLVNKYYELRAYSENPTQEIINEIGEKTNIDVKDIQKYYNLVAKYGIKSEEDLGKVISRIQSSNQMDNNDIFMLNEMSHKLSGEDIQRMWRSIAKSIGSEEFECTKGSIDLSSFISYTPPISSSSFSHPSSSLNVVTALSKLEYVESEKKRYHCDIFPLSLADILKDMKHHTSELRDIATYLAIEQNSEIKNVVDNSGYFISLSSIKNLYAPYNLFIPRTTNPEKVKVVGIRDDLKMTVDTKAKKDAFALTFHPFIQEDVSSHFWSTYEISTTLGEHLTSILIPRLKEKVRDIEDHFYAVTYSCALKCSYLPDPLVVNKEEYDKRMEDVLESVEKEMNERYDKYGLSVRLINIREVGIFEDKRYNKNRQEMSLCVCNPSTLSLPARNALKCITHYDHRIIYIPTILVEVNYKEERMLFAIQLPLDDNMCNTSDEEGESHMCSREKIEEEEIIKEGIDDIGLEDLLTSLTQ